MGGDGPTSTCRRTCGHDSHDQPPLKLRRSAEALAKADGAKSTKLTRKRVMVETRRVRRVKTPITFETVRQLAASLPGIEDGTMYRSPALKVRGTFLACVPTHKTAEPNSLAIRTSFDDRAELLAAEPGTYYLPDHYVNYPVVLVRLARVHPDALRDLLNAAWRFVTESASRRGRAKRPGDPPPARRRTTQRR
jgi:hypothetical protein